MSIVLTREQAYDLAWAAPLTTLALEVDLSNVMLGKSLREAGIPLPGVGYWAKLAAGKPVKRVLLSPPHLGTVRFVWIGGTFSSAFQARVSGPPGERSEPWEPIDELTKAFVDQIPSLRMPRAWQHEGVKKLLAKDERTRQKASAADGIFAQFYKPKFAQAAERRRLQFANRLGFALERILGSLSFRDDSAHRFSATIGSGHVSFSVETTQNGKLRLIVDERRAPNEASRWADDDNGTLETRIPEILTGLARIVVVAERQWREEMRIRRERDGAAVAELAKQRIEEEVRAAAATAKRERKKQVRALVRAARGAQESQLIRDYVERSRQLLASQYPADQIDAWAKEALVIADKLDPWKNGKAIKSLTMLPKGPDGSD